MHAFRWYLASLVLLCCGVLIAVVKYPGGYDWFYTVASALASRKHNPQGGVWFSGALALGMLMLWPYVSSIKKSLIENSISNRLAINALRLGVVCGFLVGLERLVIYDLSSWLYKSHEFLALFTFAGFYCGIIMMLIRMKLQNRVYLITFLLIIFPLVAIGITQFWLYLDQRDLGWVDTSWREMGIPVYLSFAFWQWLAIVFLWGGLGVLSLIADKHRNQIDSE